MAMLDRYKKSGGFTQLLVLVETSTKQKQEQFLGLIAQENIHWEAEIKKKSLSIDRILSWNSGYLSEIFSRVQLLTVAVATKSLSQQQVEIVMNCFSQSDQRKIQNFISERSPSPSEIQTCVLKLIAEVREMIKSGILKMEKIDPELIIPENIEEKLQQKTLLQSLDTITPPPLTFRSDEKPKSTEATPSNHALESLREENDFLKRKVLQLSNDNTQLKNELNSLKNKRPW